MKSELSVQSGKNKKEYLPPECEVFTVKSEGVICASGGGEDMQWMP